MDRIRFVDGGPFEKSAWKFEGVGGPGKCSVARTDIPEGDLMDLARMNDSVIGLTHDNEGNMAIIVVK